MRRRISAAREGPTGDIAAPRISDDDEKLLSKRKHRWRRFRLIVFATVIAALLFGGGWYAAVAFVSPAQRAAAALPPKPKTITTKVTKGTLSQTISASVAIEPSMQTAISLTSSSGRAVVTSSPAAAGSVITSSHVVLVVNGRPVIALTGNFPFYRDLLPSEEGPDISQLQEGLAKAGIAVAVTGRFDLQTEAAVKAMYEKTKFNIPASGGVPLSEILVIPAQTVTVVSTPRVGTILSPDSTILFSSGSMIARADIAASLTTTIKQGMTAQLRSTDGTQVAARVASIDAAQKDGDNASVTLVPTKAQFPSAWQSQSVVAIIELKKIADTSLIVPSGAIANAGQSESFVMKMRSDGSFVRVKIREIAELDGMSAILPLSGAGLNVGDDVEVG